MGKATAAASKRQKRVSIAGTPVFKPPVKTPVKNPEAPAKSALKKTVTTPEEAETPTKTEPEEDGGACEPSLGLTMIWAFVAAYNGLPAHWDVKVMQTGGEACNKVLDSLGKIKLTSSGKMPAHIQMPYIPEPSIRAAMIIMKNWSVEGTRKSKGKAFEIDDVLPSSWKNSNIFKSFQFTDYIMGRKPAEGSKLSKIPFHEAHWRKSHMIPPQNLCTAIKIPVLKRSLDLGECQRVDVDGRLGCEARA
ncbi:hypothetical protein NEUTE1DRAFT_111378 [Neurospora tetrasperma FGSC 2508]|uniref:Uncharacterized protein n=1 Tax=Neurospora tetrasperma (strain FGSC 2508 / ATCC MYA-4615 / P0657) TaxID=510951 RepID=F8MNN4_NEUT8|nr:uncharacterized protein NEUTE1DRAFT_111378 [Neurospora tetrasperma FGSC 2508]EGO57002.1 hypothetical protein NEUTE1DRAFT_111378 [Neurospora tetrasperma FGSC 2508]